MGALKRCWRGSLSLGLLMLIAGCSGNQGAGNANIPGGNEDGQPFDLIAEDTVINVTGNEPFWGGEVRGDTFIYTTPDNPDGIAIAVKRFAGRGGLSFNGRLNDQDIALAITPGECSDTMSDRTYPYVATLMIGDDLSAGCGWSDKMPFTGDATP